VSLWLVCTGSFLFGAAFVDESGTVATRPPHGFSERERGGRRVLYVGAQGGRFASAIDLYITPARPGSSLSAELSLVERILTARFGKNYVHLGAGPIRLNGRPAVFLLYRRPGGRGVEIRHWLVLTEARGYRISAGLSSAVGTFGSVRSVFAAFLAGLEVREESPFP